VFEGQHFVETNGSFGERLQEPLKSRELIFQPLRLDEPEEQGEVRRPALEALPASDFVRS
jgi:hypothetical protein